MSADIILYEERILALEKKLLQSINDLNDCKKENEAFIHIASHDLQAPIRKLSTFVEKLSNKSREILGEEGLSYIQRIETTLQNMRLFIDDLSALSNVADANIYFTQCDLNKEINQVITGLEAAIKENNAKIFVSPLPVIDANANQIKELFKNIIDNSLKFKNNDAIPQIIINSEVLSTEEKIVFDLPDNNVYYKIEFADNGIGFKQEYADKIFKPFFRLHGKAAYVGNGLGLAICKKIIENHQGMIYANGKENSGSRFVLILPQTHNP
jgi:light-regulated signal transduction histidine kinase (bacteriophytochrome)